MGAVIEADILGDEFKGYLLKINGGNDKDGFPMRQGVIVNGRVRLLMSKGQKTYRPRRKGEKKRKSVRGCIVGHDIRVLALTIEKKGDNDIPGLTDTVKPLRLGPKRASKIRKLHGIAAGKNNYALVTQKVVRRKFKSATGKDRHKAPSVQRLITPERLYRKKQLSVSFMLMNRT